MEKSMFLKRAGVRMSVLLAVRFCEIGWLNVSVGLCVFCSSVYSVRKRTFAKLAGEFFLSQRTFFSLTERTEFTEVFGAHFEPTEGLRHTEVTEAFQLRLAVTLCDIGWLNVSVGLCVFCSSVYSVRKRTSLRFVGEVFLSQNSQNQQTLFAHCSSPWGGGPSPNPSPVGRGVKCEVTPTRLPLKDVTKPTSFL